MDEEDLLKLIWDQIYTDFVKTKLGSDSYRL